MVLVCQCFSASAANTAARVETPYGKPYFIINLKARLKVPPRNQRKTALPKGLRKHKSLLVD